MSVIWDQFFKSNFSMYDSISSLSHHQQRFHSNIQTNNPQFGFARIQLGTTCPAGHQNNLSFDVIYTCAQ